MAKSFRFWSTLMVIICFVLGILVYGGGRYSFGIFMKPLAETMGWSRTQVSLAVTINLICYGISSPVVGWLLDTIGARKVMVTGALLMMVSLCAMYFAHNIWMFYFLYGVVSAFGANAVGRIAQASIVANWFVKRRGLMMGVTAISIGLGTAIMAPVVRYLLDAYGWQLAFVAVGVMMGVLVLLPVLLFVKGQGRPEDRGFGPDGMPLGESLQTAAAPAPAAGLKGGDWKVSDALRSKAFWAVTLAMGLSYTADYIVLLHGPADFEDRGYSGATAALVLATATLTSCFGRIGFGWLADYASIKLGFALMFGLQLIATPLVVIASSEIMLYSFAVIWGVGYGGAAVLLPYAIAHYFGRSCFSAILGWATMVTVFCGSIGGIVGGLVYDNYHSYQLAWIACGVLWALAITMVLVLGGRPAPQAQHSLAQATA
ncbi:MAG: MFS transporter [Porticoccaceae bacterium]